MPPLQVAPVAEQNSFTKVLNKSRREKTGLRGFRPGQIQTRLYNEKRDNKQMLIRYPPQGKSQ